MKRNLPCISHLGDRVLAKTQNDLETFQKSDFRSWKIRIFLAFFAILTLVHCPWDNSPDQTTNFFILSLLLPEDTSPLKCGTYPNTTVNYVTTDLQPVVYTMSPGPNSDVDPNANIVAAMFILSHVKAGQVLVLKSTSTDLTHIIQDNYDFLLEDGCPPQFIDPSNNVAVTTYTANEIRFQVNRSGNYSIATSSGIVNTFAAEPMDVTMQLE
ncbi:hypothetical protein EHQ27_07715 [Leptospira wolffii]|uniref:hypothetical protein n=1 Tax=Leptospira wolffii TaxID=409998 RepID=UPI0010845E83|nr:hypothetical protein [Leptospira wolffii]TGK64695.1 hypothetical protein EHQ32_00280 [Leptospira wolffii]TGK72783.1 hypothetical protein EHQ27_07715 [Leptospira wolffii]TGK76906.1 hypothetical protein EHQ35_00935 [Leptospira wolffii]TGL26637.1 hypothetical protein EHQ57_18115 [Leptospira wolffii]